MVEVEKIKKVVVDIIRSGKSRDEILSDISTVLKKDVYHYDWVGFYILDEVKTGLFLGPYAGAHTDHTYIPVGRGVCGQVAQSKMAMVVQDVNSIDNYLSCSINVQSEIVVPIIKNNEFVAELDIDSHSPAPFTENDTQLLQFICSKLAVLF